VVDLSSSSDEEDFIADTLWDAEFARWLFGNLNCDVLGLLSDGNVIILNDSDEEEEAHEETAANTDVTPSAAVKSLAPTTFVTDADEDPGKMQDNNSDGLALEQDMGKNSSGRDEASSP
jgi:hypothetical protein